MSPPIYISKYLQISYFLQHFPFFDMKEAKKFPQAARIIVNTHIWTERYGKKRDLKIFSFFLLKNISFLLKKYIQKPFLASASDVHSTISLF